MACSEPYQNPAGLKFVTRVNFNLGDALYTNALAGEQIVLSIPNGAGPGTVIVGTRDTYATWTVTDSKNLVRNTQRAYTGVACWEQLWVEDGCTVSVILLERDSVNHYDEDGIQRAGNVESRIFAMWFPASVGVHSFSRLSLASGPAGTSNPYPIRAPTSGPVIVSPPGLCRYIAIGSDAAVDVRFENINAAANPLWELVSGVTTLCRFVPAWGIVTIVPVAGSVSSTVCWNRYPMYGG